MRSGYRRVKKRNMSESECFEKIYTKDGFDTHTWKKVFTLHEFVYNVCSNKQIHFEMWQNFTSEKGLDKWLINYLENHVGYRV